MEAIDPFVFRLSIFVLAIFVGYFVVWSVTPALHTPLMSVTNAISSVIVVGALIAVSVAVASGTTESATILDLQRPRLRRADPGLGEHLRRLPGHQPHARDVQEEREEMSAGLQADLAALAYLVSGVLFILALRGLSSPTTSRTGNRSGMIGMALAIITTLWVAEITDQLTWGLIVVGIGIGGSIGAIIARRIAMTADAAAGRGVPQSLSVSPRCWSRARRFIRRAPIASAPKARSGCRA